jgi:hypothetical protein
VSGAITVRWWKIGSKGLAVVLATLAVSCDGADNRHLRGGRRHGSSEDSALGQQEEVVMA